MKELEHLEGTGTVTTQDGNDIPVLYDIHITQDEVQGESGPASNAGSKHITGQVWSARDPSFVITHFRENMTLKMEDGRQFRFFHRDPKGNIGLTKWIG
jgi:hypothetical protein